MTATNGLLSPNLCLSAAHPARFVEQALNHSHQRELTHEEEPVQIRDGTGDERRFCACSEYDNAGAQHAKDFPRSDTNAIGAAEHDAESDVRPAAVRSNAIVLHQQPDAIVFCSEFRGAKHQHQQQQRSVFKPGGYQPVEFGDRQQLIDFELAEHVSIEQHVAFEQQLQLHAAAV